MKNNDKLTIFEIAKFLLAPVIGGVSLDEMRIDGLLSLKEYLRMHKRRDNRLIAFVRYTDRKFEALDAQKLL
jgi:hypothetical protein